MRFLTRLWSQYTRSLQTSPYTSNIVSTAVITCSGDVVAQTIEQYHREATTVRRQGCPTSYDPNALWDSYSALRSASMFSWGLTWGGAPLVYWFQTLEKNFPGTKVRTVATKIAINCTIQAPLTNALFLGWCIYWSSPSFPHTHGFLEKWREKLKLDMVSTTLRSWSVWVPVHTINFFFVPPHLRVLCVSTCAFLWTTYLSIVGHRK